MTDPEIKLRVTKVTSDIPDTFKFKVEDFDGDFGALSDVNCLYPMKDDSGVERTYLWSAGILILKVPINNSEEPLYWVIPKTAQSVDTDRGDWDISLANQFIITICPSVDDSVRWIPFNPLADIGTVWTYPVSEEPEEEETVVNDAERFIANADEKFKTAADKAEEAVEDAAEEIEEAAEKIEEKAEETAEKAEEVVEKTAEKAEKTVKEAVKKPAPKKNNNGSKKK